MRVMRVIRVIMGGVISVINVIRVIRVIYIYIPMIINKRSFLVTSGDKSKSFNRVSFSLSPTPSLIILIFVKFLSFPPPSDSRLSGLIGLLEL